ncbi:hypothetical protein AAEP93_007922 [Penicillium crustosum]
MKNGAPSQLGQSEVSRTFFNSPRKADPRHIKGPHPGFLNFLLSTTSITSIPDLIWHGFPDFEWDTAGPVHIEQVPSFVGNPKPRQRLTLVGWWQGTCTEHGLSWIVLSALNCQNAQTKSVPSPQDCTVILGEADGILCKSHRFLLVWKPEAESVCAAAIQVAHLVLGASRTQVQEPSWEDLKSNWECTTSV